MDRTEATARLRERGFDVGVAPLHAIREVLPWAFPMPTSGVLVGRGRIDDAEALWIDYCSTLASGDGGGGTRALPTASSSWHSVITLRHPRITGSAVFYPDPRAWSRVARAIDVASWLPPFVIVRAAAWLLGTLAGFENAKDRVVGDPEFDRLFRVHAPSDEVAAVSIAPALREFMIASKCAAMVQIRDGEMLFSLPRNSFDAAYVDAVLRFAPSALRACVEGRGAPMR